MNGSTQLEGGFYSYADITEIANIFGLDSANSESLNHISERIEQSAFFYHLALEDKKSDPTIPASRRAPKVLSQAAALENATKKIRRFPPQISGDLIRVANELGDKVGRQYGANDLFDALKGIDWIVGCLRTLEAEYIAQKSDSGGNRKDIAKHRFLDALHEIVMEFKGEPLKWRTRGGPAKGPLIDFLNVCFRPFPKRSDPASLATAYDLQIKRSEPENNK